MPDEKSPTVNATISENKDDSKINISSSRSFGGMPDEIRAKSSGGKKKSMKSQK